MTTDKVAIIIVSFNAPRYLLKALWTIRRKTKGVAYEVVVVDNDSRLPTRLIVAAAGLLKVANRAALLDRNTLFAEGCNIGTAMSARDCSHVLLLNSDTEVRRSDWLSHLLGIHRRGATAYGYVAGGPIPRADGYCFLIDRNLMLEHRLDESFQWWWGATRLQADLLRSGHSVQAVEDHEAWLVHKGGASGKSWKGARGMETSPDEVRSWFGSTSVTVV